MINENVDFDYYSLSEETFIRATEGFLIRKTENEKWELVFEERGVQKVEGIYNNPHDSCTYLHDTGNRQLYSSFLLLWKSFAADQTGPPQRQPSSWPESTWLIGK